MRFVHSPDKYKLLGLPMVILRPKSKPWYLNLNVYRNTHGKSLGSLKKKYASEIEDRFHLPVIHFPPPWQFEYTIFFATRARVDLMNYGSIVDKFVCDVLVENEVIDDDDRVRIPKVSFIDGGVVGERYADLVITQYRP